MEDKIDVIKLEDGLDYAIIEEIKNDNVTYIYLTNILDENDFCIRKIQNISGEEYLVGLDNEQEYKNALKLFIKK